VIEHQHYKRNAKVLKELIQHTLDDNKALDIVSLDLEGKSDVAFFMVIASGTSGRHVGALAGHIEKAIKESGMTEVATEGMPTNDWVLLDNPLVVVHLFRPEVREHYNLEKMWQADFSDVQSVHV
jgi:ribosome-associated protein